MAIRRVFMLAMATAAIAGCHSAGASTSPAQSQPAEVHVEAVSAAVQPAAFATVATSGGTSAAKGRAPRPCKKCRDGLWVELPDEGTVSLSLVPGKAAPVKKPVMVSFGIPFPPGVVSDVANIRVLYRGKEIPARVAETVRWRPLGGGKTTESVRAAVAHVEVTLARRKPMALEVQWGARRKKQLELPARVASDPRASWVTIKKQIDPAEYPDNEDIREPTVYAVYHPSWLSASLLRSRSTAVGDREWSWWDEFMVGAARTAVNDVRSTVNKNEYIQYTGSHEPWLFDRAMTLWGVYFRTGDVKWLRHAHRAAQFYARHVDGQGYFDLKGKPDIKYGYGQSLLIDLMLTGDTSLLATIERIARAATTFNTTYRPGRFWTERHQSYALLAALSAWEATGDPKHAERVTDVVTATFDMTRKPREGWKAEGCPLHRFRDHEGWGTKEPICSPWMGAFLAEAIWRYYLHARDERALQFLASMGRFMATTGLYFGKEGLDHVVPWYLVSSRFQNGKPWSGFEHTCDIYGLITRGAWAQKALGRDPEPLLDGAKKLAISCRENLKYWHRGAKTKAEWRLAPPRKFNWWFGTTVDMQWLLVDLESE